MSGTICLQGGAEFGRACNEMDREIVMGAPPGPIVVLAGAAAPGRDYAQASRNAVRYYGRWVGDDVVAAPDPRDDLDGCLDVLQHATLVVLPGGSPRRLLDILSGPVGQAIVDQHERGASLSGASAGAMVLCASTIVPDGDGEVVDGLGLVPGLALPHFTGEDRWAGRVPNDVPRWGLPECGGVVVDAGRVRAVGAGQSLFLAAGTRTPVPRDGIAVDDLVG